MRQFLLFCWLFTLLVIAAFTDMVAGTFVGTGIEDASVAYANSSAASISMLFILVAVVFGLIQKKVGKMNELVKFLESFKSFASALTLTESSLFSSLPPWG